MGRPVDTCPECGGASTREWLAGSSERRQCLSGHVWEGDALPLPPSVEDRLANIERAIADLRALVEVRIEGISKTEMPRWEMEALGRSETRRPT